MFYYFINYNLCLNNLSNLLQKKRKNKINIIAIVIKLKKIVKNCIKE